MAGMKKNFKYGELWDISDKNHPKTDKTGITPIDSDKITRNAAFSRFLDEEDYRVFLDYNTDEIAYTDVTNRRVVLNGRHSQEMLTALLQHELGHLMLFNVNQFTTIRENTLRSSICAEIYKPEHVREYGIRALLELENIIQDVIIETVADGNCVCHQSLLDLGYNQGVKHLDSLESVSLIAREGTRNHLKMLDSMGVTVNTVSRAKDSRGLLKGMISGLEADLLEIEAKIEKVASSTEYLDSRETKRYRVEQQIMKRLDKIRNKKIKPADAARIRAVEVRLKERLKSIRSDVHKAELMREAEEERQRNLKRLWKKYHQQRRLRDAFHDELMLVPEGSDENSAVPGLHPNRTDHLEDDAAEVDPEDEVQHSYDCGLPHPVTVERGDSEKNERRLKRLSGSTPKIRKIYIENDSDDDDTQGRRKSPENEFTYFKPSKKEFSGADMLKGKRRIRTSGINVLIGLDVSGSMSSEWTDQFTEISEMVLELQETLDIEDVIFFTYDHTLKENSRTLSDLHLAPSGGNAFGYVYAQMMSVLPVKRRNEIILVTDCGDNLGFNLNAVAEVTKEGQPVENHVSIIDTEGAGFYSVDAFVGDQWALYSRGDPELNSKISENISDLLV